MDLLITMSQSERSSIRWSCNTVTVVLPLQMPKAWVHLGAEGHVCFCRNLPHAQAMICYTPLLSLLLDARVLRGAVVRIESRPDSITKREMYVTSCA